MELGSKGEGGQFIPYFKDLMAVEVASLAFFTDPLLAEKKSVDWIPTMTDEMDALAIPFPILCPIITVPKWQHFDTSQFFNKDILVAATIASLNVLIIVICYF